jgi:hypothetical protein
MIYSKASEKKIVKVRYKPCEYKAIFKNGFLLPKLNSKILKKIYMNRLKSE